MIHCLHTDFKEKHYKYFDMFSFCSLLTVVEKTYHLWKKEFPYAEWWCESFVCINTLNLIYQCLNKCISHAHNCFKFKKRNTCMHSVKLKLLFSCRVYVKLMILYLLVLSSKLTIVGNFLFCRTLVSYHFDCMPTCCQSTIKRSVFKIS